MRFDNAEAIRAMIRTGLGISMLPMRTVDQDLRSGRLTHIRQKEPPLHSKIALISRRSTHVPRPVREAIAQARGMKRKNPRLVAPAPRAART